MTELVREGHQSHRAQAGLHIFFRLVFRQAFEDFFELRFENFEGVGDRDFEKSNSQIFGERASVINTATRREGTRHRDSGHVVSSKRIDGDNCCDGRIDSAAQADHC